jgi:hypothetical protein
LVAEALLERGSLNAVQVRQLFKQAMTGHGKMMLVDAGPLTY